MVNLHPDSRIGDESEGVPGYVGPEISSENQIRENPQSVLTVGSNCSKDVRQSIGLGLGLALLFFSSCSGFQFSGNSGGLFSSSDAAGRTDKAENIERANKSSSEPSGLAQKDAAACRTDAQGSPKILNNTGELDISVCALNGDLSQAIAENHKISDKIDSNASATVKVSSPVERAADHPGSLSIPLDESNSAPTLNLLSSNDSGDSEKESDKNSDQRLGVLKLARKGSTNFELSLSGNVEIKDGSGIVKISGNQLVTLVNVEHLPEHDLIVNASIRDASSALKRLIDLLPIEVEPTLINASGVGDHDINLEELQKFQPWPKHRRERKR